jgi:hypothetical protein
LKRAIDMSLFAVHSAQCHCSGRKRFRPPRPSPWGQREYAAMDNRTVDHGAKDNGTLGQWNWENRLRGQRTMGQSDFGKWDKRVMGQWDIGHWDNGEVNHGGWTMDNVTMDNGTMGQSDRGTIGNWDNGHGDNRTRGQWTL